MRIGKSKEANVQQQWANWPQARRAGHCCCCCIPRQMCLYRLLVLLDQMTLPGLSDDSGHCPPLLPLCTTVERSITVKKSTTVEKSTCGEKLSGNSGHWPPLSVWSTCLSAHILHYSNTTTVSIKGVSELKDC